MIEIFWDAIEEFWNIHLGLALAIGGGMVAGGWAIGELLAAPAVRSWARDEIKEYIRTLAIVALLAPGLIILHLLFVALVGDDPFGYAHAFVASVHTQLFDLFFYLSGVFWGWIPFASLKATIPIFKIPATVEFGTAFGQILDTIELVFSPLITTTLAVVALGQMLTFVEKIALSFILPLGVALRAFPLTRRTGSTLIALAVTAYIVLPVAVGLVATVWHSAFETLSLEAHEAGVILSPRDIPPVGLNVWIIRHFPPPEKYFLNRTDTLQWEILAEEGMWRIWREDCVKCTETCVVEAGKQPPPEIDCDCWSMQAVGLGGAIMPVGCFKREANGTFVVGKAIEFSLENFRDGKYTFVIDAYEKNITYLKTLPEGAEVEVGKKWIPLGFDEVTFQLGDPCAGFLNAVECWLGIRQSIEEKARITPEISIGKLVEGAVGELGIVGVVKRPQYLIAPPFTAPLVVRDLTEKLPYIMLPVAVVVISLVLIAVLLTSSFRGLSMALGGEPTLFGIGRIL